MTKTLQLERELVKTVIWINPPYEINGDEMRHTNWE